MHWLQDGEAIGTGKVKVLPSPFIPTANDEFTKPYTEKDTTLWTTPQSTPQRNMVTLSREDGGNILTKDAMIKIIDIWVSDNCTRS